MHLIDLKFGTYIIGLHRTNSVDFGECQMQSFFTEVQERILKHSYTFLYILPTELNYLKVSSIETAHSIELKFGRYIIDHCLKYCIDFGEFRVNSIFLNGVRKRNSYTL